MLKTKLFTAIALMAALLLLAPAAYADTGSTTGSFGAKAQPPVVESIKIYDAVTDSEVDSMTPQQPYYALLNVTCVNKLKHLETVQATIYYDEDGTDPAPAGGGDTQKLAILTWTATGEVWDIDSGGGSTTWELDPLTYTSSHSDVTGSLTNGDWLFYFMPGKVATEAPSVAYADAEWDAEGLAINKTGGPGGTSAPEYLDTDKEMVWYGEIELAAGTADWGDVDLGLVFNDAANPKPDTGLSINYIANGDYYEDIASEDWASGGETVALCETGTADDDTPPAAAGEFALKADNDATLADAVVVKKVTTDYVHIGDTGDQTGEAGVDVAANSLWLSLSTSGIYPGTYEGSIWYQILERP
ncbi:MAG: hypothetical protein JXB43_03395 [Dehalococcoidia bacterium]|nr:hypothetical protein [Dehalococcoidia bacterium]